MSNYVYGYLVTPNQASALEDIQHIVDSQILGFLIETQDQLFNFPAPCLPIGNDNIVFYIADGKDTNVAQFLLDGWDYVVNPGDIWSNDLPQEARKRREILIDLLIQLVQLDQIDKLYVALTDNQEIEAVKTVFLENLRETILNDCEKGNHGTPPNVLYIVEKTSLK